jgi:hypothetical protein
MGREASYYLIKAQEAEDRAAEVPHPLVKEAMLEIGKVYRRLAVQARAAADAKKSS